jgi:hypothetical protein
VKRLYHHYEQWEEISHGMWRRVLGQARKPLLEQAACLMRDSVRFHAAMLLASQEWKYSCEAHLTGGYNRQAWMGHAGCCLATGSPEDVTREAWHTLTQSEQDLANEAADRVLADWDIRNA